MQTFKMKHHTIVYEGGGQYRLKADKGYKLRSAAGEEVAEATTRDYRQWKVVESIESEIKEQTGRRRGRRAVNPERDFAG